MKSLGGKKALIVTDAFLEKQGMAAMIQGIFIRSRSRERSIWGRRAKPKDTNVRSRIKGI